MSSQLDKRVKGIQRFQHSHRMSMLHCLVRTPMTEPCSVSVETAGGSCVLLFGHRTSVLGSINMHVRPSTLCVGCVCVMLSVQYMSEAFVRVSVWGPY
jgi:hypothetical protein